jgi:hypothetical protein
VLPQDQKKAGRKIGAPPPAPERMDVNPATPKSSQLTPPGDPWAQPDYPAAPAPQPMQPAMPDPNDPNDLFGGLGGGNSQSAVMFGVLDHACKKLKSCPNADASLDAVCSQFATITIPAPTCDAATRCFTAIDTMSCSQNADVSSVLQLSECVSAMQDC